MNGAAAKGRGAGDAREGVQDSIFGAALSQ